MQTGGCALVIREEMKTFSPPAVIDIFIPRRNGQLHLPDDSFKQSTQGLSGTYRMKKAFCPLDFTLCDLQRSYLTPWVPLFSRLKRGRVVP